MATKQYLNTGLPLETGLRAALRHHQNELKKYKVQKNKEDLRLHQMAVQQLEGMLQMREPHSTYGTRDERIRRIHELNGCYRSSRLARADLLGLVPPQLLDQVGQLDRAAAHRADVLGELEYTPVKG